MGGAIRHILYAQISLLLTVIVCASANPATLWTHTGLSFYGNFKDTLFQYVLGLGLAAFCLSRAADYIVPVSENARLLRGALKISGLALAGIVISPTLVSRWSAVAHVLFAIVLFAAQAIVGIRLATRLNRGRFNTYLLYAQVSGLVGIVLSFRQVGGLSIMLPAQVLELFAFTTLAIRALLEWGQGRQTRHALEQARTWPTGE